MVRLFPLALVACLSTSALAVECAAPKGSTPHGIAAQSPEARIAFLSNVLGQQAEVIRLWKLLWGAGYGLMTAGQLALMPLLSEHREDWVIGAASSAVGFAVVVIDPMEVIEGGPLFVQRARTATPEQRCQLLIDGERMLGAGAKKQAFSTSWISHVVNVLFNVGVGMILGLGYGRWQTAGVNGAVGIAIGEATTLTTPTGMIDGWERYRTGGKSDSKVTVRLVPAGIGAGLVLTF